VVVVLVVLGVVEEWEGLQALNMGCWEQVGQVEVGEVEGEVEVVHPVGEVVAVEEEEGVREDAVRVMGVVAMEP
jgi:hypothetical protein